MANFTKLDNYEQSRAYFRENFRYEVVWIPAPPPPPSPSFFSSFCRHHHGSSLLFLFILLVHFILLLLLLPLLSLLFRLLISIFFFFIIVIIISPSFLIHLTSPQVDLNRDSFLSFQEFSRVVGNATSYAIGNLSGTEVLFRILDRSGDRRIDILEYADGMAAGAISTRPRVLWPNVTACHGAIAFPKFFWCPATAQTYQDERSCVLACSSYCKDLTTSTGWQYEQLSVVVPLMQVHNDPLLANLPGVLTPYIGGVMQRKEQDYLVYVLNEPNAPSRSIFLRPDASFLWLLKAGRGCPSLASDYRCGTCPGMQPNYRINFRVYDTETAREFALSSLRVLLSWCCDGLCPGGLLFNSSSDAPLPPSNLSATSSFALSIPAGTYLISVQTSGYNFTQQRVTVYDTTVNVSVPIFRNPAGNEIVLALSWGMYPSSLRLRAQLGGAVFVSSVAAIYKNDELTSWEMLGQKPDLIRIVMQQSAGNFVPTSFNLSDAVQQQDSPLLSSSQTFVGGEEVQVISSSGVLVRKSLSRGGGDYWRLGRLDVKSSTSALLVEDEGTSPYSKPFALSCSQALGGVCSSSTSIAGVSIGCCSSTTIGCSGRLCDPLSTCKCPSSSSCSFYSLSSPGTSCGVGASFAADAGLP